MTFDLNRLGLSLLLNLHTKLYPRKFFRILEMIELLRFSDLRSDFTRRIPLNLGSDKSSDPDQGSGS